jgi:hypothetical protein
VFLSVALASKKSVVAAARAGALADSVS